MSKWLWTIFSLGAPEMRARDKRTATEENFRCWCFIRHATSGNHEFLIESGANFLGHEAATYLKTLELKAGEGIFLLQQPQSTPWQTWLLGGSILAGNNGEILEFSQIAHLLTNQMIWK